MQRIFPKLFPKLINIINKYYLKAKRNNFQFNNRFAMNN